jgi:hypothetical protein
MYIYSLRIYTHATTGVWTLLYMNMYVHIHGWHTTGVWAHIVLSMRRISPTSASAKQISYVNGVVAVTTDVYFPSAKTSTNYIGRAIMADRHYTGSIDSFYIFPWALSPPEVQLVFRATTNTMVCCLMFGPITCQIIQEIMCRIKQAITPNGSHPQSAGLCLCQHPISMRGLFDIWHHTNVCACSLSQQVQYVPLAPTLYLAKYHVLWWVTEHFTCMLVWVHGANRSVCMYVMYVRMYVCLYGGYHHISTCSCSVVDATFIVLYTDFQVIKPVKPKTDWHVHAPLCSVLLESMVQQQASVHVPM